MTTSISAWRAAFADARETAAARRGLAAAAALLAFSALAGCALTPKGLDDERARLEAAATAAPVPEEALPMPRGGDDWRALLRRALLANGDLRGAWFEWKAAVERVSGASAWPNSNLMVGYSYAFSDENVKTFDRMTFSAGFDAMENLSFPTKAMASGRIALAEAQTAGEKFRAAKFALQRKVLDAWLDLVLAAESERLAAESRTLASIAAAGADASLVAGGEQGPATSAAVASARADDEAAKARAEVAMAKAKLAALAWLPDASRIRTPERLPSPRPLPSDPSVLVAAAADAPMAAEQHAEARRSDEETDLAKQQWIPDVNPTAMFAGGMEQVIGAAIVLPTAFVEIRSAIAASRAMRDAAAERARQAGRTGAGEVAAMLVAAGDAERSRRLLEQRVLPAARLAAEASRSAYGTGGASFADMLEARTLVVEVRREIVEAAVTRERQLAAIEEILGADLETFVPAPRAVAAVDAAEPAGPLAAAARPDATEVLR